MRRALSAAQAAISELVEEAEAMRAAHASQQRLIQDLAEQVRELQEAGRHPPRASEDVDFAAMVKEKAQRRRMVKEKAQRRRRCRKRGAQGPQRSHQEEGEEEVPEVPMGT